MIWFIFFFFVVCFSFLFNFWVVNLFFLYDICKVLGIGYICCLFLLKLIVNVIFLLLSLLEDFVKLVGFFFWYVVMVRFWYFFDKLLFLLFIVKFFVIWYVKVLKFFVIWRVVVISLEDVIFGVLLLMFFLLLIRDFCWRSSLTLCVSFLVVFCRLWIFFSFCFICCCVRLYLVS